MDDGQEEALSDYFWRVAGRLRHRSRETLAPWDISPSHFRALGVLLQRGPMRPGDLSDQLHIAPRSVTEVVDTLQERGLVERQPDPTDRRATQLVLTPAGHEIGQAIRTARTADAERFFAVLTETDRAHLRRILRKLTPDD